MYYKCDLSIPGRYLFRWRRKSDLSNIFAVYINGSYAKVSLDFGPHKQLFVYTGNKLLAWYGNRYSDR